MDAPSPSSNELAAERTGIAFERTRLAFERTLLAWVRTAVSLISFGFTIYKFFQYVRDDAQRPVREHLLEPRGVALVMIALGVFALIFATLEYRRSLRALRLACPTMKATEGSLAMMVAITLALLGLAGLVLVSLNQ
jgi:putative membrane protein